MDDFHTGVPRSLQLDGPCSSRLREYKRLSKACLIRRILELERAASGSGQVRDSASAIPGDLQARKPSTEVASSKKKKSKEFVFSRYAKRHIALKVSYLGWNYDGFASQDNTPETIECKLFNAFKSARLVDNDDIPNYSRCGRTDKGVSALCQVCDCRNFLLAGSKCR
jgi:tRNA pseudouridine38/39 synthase